VEAEAPDDLEAAFKEAARGGASDSWFSSRRPSTSNNRVSPNSPSAAGWATIYEEKDYVEAGGFMSYHANYADTFGRAAYFVDRILKGAKPASSRWSSRRGSNWPQPQNGEGPRSHDPSIDRARADRFIQ